MMSYSAADATGSPAGRRFAPPTGPAVLEATDARRGLTDLYEREYATTARIAYLVCGDRTHAEDLAHDAFARLYASWDRVADPTRRVAYLRTTVVNLARSSFRRRAVAERFRGTPGTTDGAGVVGSVEDAALGLSVRPDVMAALSTLSPKQRAAVVLKHWLRMTEGEIAEALGCSVGSVRTHLARGHEALSARLDALR